MAGPRILIIGAGFAGFHAARTLGRLAREKASVTLLNPTDYFLYAPLLPEVATGVLEPRRISVPLATTLPGVRLLPGEARSLDLDRRTVEWTDAEGGRSATAYDRLIVAVGSVNKLLPIPGVTEHAHGFRGMPEALYLRDHITRQIELADVAEDSAERDARCTFVVVGAGYTGTELAAHGHLFTDALAHSRPGLGRPRWFLIDVAPRVLAELDPRLSATAAHVLEQRGVIVRTQTSVRLSTAGGVRLTDGSFIPTRSLIWCVGVRPDPFVEESGLPTDKGRLIVDERLSVPGHPEIFACGDAAAVPDPSRPGQATPMTAQHAVRQGRLAAYNVAASCGAGEAKPYRARELGFAVDLGGTQAAANPFRLPLSGPAAKAVTRGYHLLALPGNRLRVAGDWLLDALLPRPAVQLGLVRAAAVPLENTAPELPAPPPPEGEATSRKARKARTTRTVREIMTEGPVTVGERTSVHDAARRMRDADIGDVLVTDDGRLRGVVTDRDLVVRVLAEGKDPERTAVGEICSEEIVSVGPDDDIGRAVELMRTHALRRLPVMEGQRPVGIVSIGDLALDRDRSSALADISAAEPNT